MKRVPVNVALVIDKSGSMSGEKIARAKEAALAAVDRLNGNDIVSVVAYDTSVRVLVPATKVSNRDQIREGIDALAAGGSTALFAGVSKGAAEIRKFLDEDRVNRVILLSDGLANVGPDSPGELGDLGRIAEAKKMLYGNAGYLNTNAVLFKSEKLRLYSIDNGVSIGNLDDSKWHTERKRMREQQTVNEYQRTW